MYIVIYTKSLLHELTTPSWFKLSDTVSSVSAIAFTDRDLDEGELGGTVTWDEPAETFHVTFYAVYLSEDDIGETKSFNNNDNEGNTINNDNNELHMMILVILAQTN